jgi:hypothetical protein
MLPPSSGLTLVSYVTTKCHNPEHINLKVHRRENPISRKYLLKLHNVNINIFLSDDYLTHLIGRRSFEVFQVNVVIRIARYRPSRSYCSAVAANTRAQAQTYHMEHNRSFFRFVNELTHRTSFHVPRALMSRESDSQ